VPTINDNRPVPNSSSISRLDRVQGATHRSVNQIQAGTLQFDGTALGRWVVDHLARTLSRSPSGMTGVDPRVIAPRSKLTPF
jgi:hypothetical protein